MNPSVRPEVYFLITFTHRGQREVAGLRHPWRLQVGVGDGDVRVEAAEPLAVTASGGTGLAGQALPGPRIGTIRPML